VGPAATCVCAPADNLALHHCLATAEPGSVLLCDAGGKLDGGYLGELMATDAIRRGIQGLVIAGSVRDVRQLEALGFPVFCLGISIPSCQKARAVSVGEPVTLDGVYVEQGDQIVADADGVVVVPQTAWPAVAEGAQRVQEREDAVMERLEAGECLAEILSLPGANLAGR
jgi:4-hydroxy-4-methyl-2-oxoglutarate aldolase